MGFRKFVRKAVRGPTLEEREARLGNLEKEASLSEKEARVMRRMQKAKKVTGKTQSPIAKWAEGFSKSADSMARDMEADFFGPRKRKKR